jgi:hypothetical protein
VEVNQRCACQRSPGVGVFSQRQTRESLYTRDDEAGVSEAIELEVTLACTECICRAWTLIPMPEAKAR